MPITFIIRVEDCSAGALEVRFFLRFFFSIQNTIGDDFFYSLCQKLFPEFDLNIKNIDERGHDNDINM